MNFKELKEIAKIQGRGLFYKPFWLTEPLKYENASDFLNFDPVKMFNFHNSEKINSQEYVYSGWCFDFSESEKLHMSIKELKALQDITFEILK